MTDYYQHEKFLKAFYSKEEIKHGKNMVKVLSYVPNFESRYSVFRLSNGVIISLKTNLDPKEDMSKNWESEKTYQVDRKYEDDLSKRLKRYELTLQILVDLVMNYILFVEKYKDVVDQDELNTLKDHTNETFNVLKGDLVTWNTK